MHFLFAPVSNIALVIFRVFLGTILACFGVIELRSNLRRLTRGKILIGFELTRFLRPLPFAAMRALLIFEILAAIAFALGWLAPWSAAALCVVRTYLLLLDRERYNNHHYLILLLLFLYAIVGADHVAWVPRWQVLIIQIQLALVYFFGGLAKLNRDWVVRGMPFRWELYTFRPATGRPWWRRRILPSGWTVAALTIARRPRTTWIFIWGGLLFDLSIGFLLLNPRTQHWALLPFFAFHLFNHWFFGLGIFPYVNYASVVLFIHPRIYDTLTIALAQPETVSPRLGSGFFWGYLALQLLIPLRRYALALTSRGRVSVFSDHHHHFSWTMKLLNVMSQGFELQIFDRATNATIRRVNFKKYVSVPTFINLGTSPRAIMMFVERLEPLLRAEPALAGIDFGIRARLSLAHNRNPLFVAIDPGVDLRKERVRLFTAYPWQWGAKRESPVEPTSRNAAVPIVTPK